MEHCSIPQQINFECAFSKRLFLNLIPSGVTQDLCSVLVWLEQGINILVS